MSKKILFQGVETNKHFSKCFLNSTPTDGSLMAFNDKYLALAYGELGNIKLLNPTQIQPINNNILTIESENSYILDMEFSPFYSNMLCFGNENGNVFLSRINHESANNSKYNSTIYKGFNKKVNFINFNPIESNKIISGTSYGDIHIWDSKEFKTYMKYKSDNPITILWSPNGDLIGVSSGSITNRFLSIYDPRNKNAVYQVKLYPKSIISKFAWLDNNTIATICFNEKFKNALSLIDIRKNNNHHSNNPFSTIEIEKYTSKIIPFFNPELKLIYCVGKNESAIKIFDYWNGSINQNIEFKASERNMFSVLLNRKYLNKSKMEIDKFARYTYKKNIFFVNFNMLPGQNFDGILYPNEKISNPQIDSKDWIIGKKIGKNKKKYERSTSVKINNFMTEKKQKINNLGIDTSKNNSDHSNFTEEKKVPNLIHTPENISPKYSFFEKNTSKSNEKKLFTSTKLIKQKSDISANKKTIYYEDKKKKENLENQIKELEDELIKKDIEINEYKNNNCILREKYEKLNLSLQEKEKQYQVLVNDNKKKVKRLSQNIDNMITQINEKNILIQQKDKEIIKYQEDLKTKDNIIEENKYKIKSLEEENKKYLEEINEIKQKYELIVKKLEDKLNCNSIEEMIFEYEKKILLLKQQLKKNYEEEMKKKIDVIKNQYEEDISQLLNNIRKNLIKVAENNIKNLKDKYNNIYTTKEDELNQKCIEITKLNINIKENKIYYNKLKEENKNIKKEISRYPFKLLENEHIISLILMTRDEKLMIPLMCKNTDKFNKIEEQFFKEFPEYSENKGNFYSHNNNLLKAEESLEKSNIKTNDIIIYEYKNC